MQNRPPLAAAAVLTVFAVGYTLQVATPMRITWDVATYLTLAGSLLDGRGLSDSMVEPVYPPGYPLLIALVARLGLNVSNALVALNVVAVAAATFAAAGLSRHAFGRSERAAWWTAALVPSSYFVGKYTVLLIADITFMSLATLAVLAMTRAVLSATDRSASAAVRFLITAALAIAAAFLLRSSAIALVPAFAVSASIVWQSPVSRIAALVRTRPLTWAAAALVAVGASGAWVFTATSYGRAAASIYGQWGVGVLVNNLRCKLTEGGEMMLNAPRGRLEQVGVPAEVLWALGSLGFVLLVVSVVSMRRERAAQPALTYVVAFVAMLVLWPGCDPRFWLGVWPVVLATVVAAVSGWNRLAVRSAQAWSAAFVAVALVALGLSMRISLAGPKFPERYTGSYDQIYRAAWSGAAPPDSSVLGLRYYRALVRFSVPE